MSDPTPDGVSRRHLVFGAGAAALAAGAAVSFSDVAGAGAGGSPSRLPFPAVLGAPIAGLTYLPVDAFALFPYNIDVGTPNTPGRLYQDVTGVQPVAVPDNLAASLSLPVGSVVRQINVAYQGQPILSIKRRDMNAPAPVQDASELLVTAPGGGPQTQTFNLTTPVTIQAASTYFLNSFHSAGDSVLGVTIGYTPPLQGFVPFSGTNPRVLDTRTGGGTKLNPGEERAVAVAEPGARSALFNLAIVNTEGSPANPGGFVACFAANVAYPGNASINWFGANQILSNSIICPVDANGAIKIRGGANRTDVVIDRIGSMF